VEEQSVHCKLHNPLRHFSSTTTFPQRATEAVQSRVVNVMGTCIGRSTLHNLEESISILDSYRQDLETKPTAPPSPDEDEGVDIEECTDKVVNVNLKYTETNLKLFQDEVKQSFCRNFSWKLIPVQVSVKSTIYTINAIHLNLHCSQLASLKIIRQILLLSSGLEDFSPIFEKAIREMNEQTRKVRSLQKLV
jgi:hypothetical protein